MAFNSLHFLLFFPAVVSLYFLCPYRWRWILLLSASYYFYMCWNVNYAILIATSTLVTYLTGLKMGALLEKKDRKKWLISSLVINLGILFVFKYFNFLNGSLHSVFGELGIDYGVPDLEFLLPVGISFYTFQALSYSIDVYRGDRKSEKHLGIYALYVSFFPQLVAGPIERSTHLLPQFFRKFDFDYDRVTDGLKLMAWGFFKKVVIADRLAVIVNNIYSKPTEYTGVPLIIASIFFAYQVYCDFSGYSDIARGSARVLGYDITLNFDRPFFSRSIGEFWRRFHITLIRWFVDYIYIPLGGSRVSKWKFYRNIAIVFLISGIWHGAAWTYVMWGALYAFFAVFGVATLSLRKKIHTLVGLTKLPMLHQVIQILITFCVYDFCIIVFRSNNLSDAYYIYTHLFTGVGHFILNIMDVGYVRSVMSQFGVAQNELILCFILIFVLETFHVLQGINNIKDWFTTRPIWIRWAAYYFVIGMIVFFGAFNSSQQFVYFQF